VNTFLFLPEDVNARSHQSFPFNVRMSPVRYNVGHPAAAHLQKIPTDSGNFLWYVTDSVAILQHSYSEVVVNAMDLAMNQLFSDVGRP